jgi:membrane-associated phospholipid phosphatase
MRTTDVEITVGLRWAVVGVVLLVLGVVLGTAIALDADPVDIDVWWNGLVDVFAPLMRPLAFILDAAGGGWVATYVIPLAAALLLVLVRRPWSAGFFLAASLVSALIVQLLKGIYGRVRPDEILVISDHGSYPSGHTANAATIAVILIVIFPRAWVAVLGLGWIFLMALSRTQVHAHWFSDTVGGTLVGAGAALVVAGVFVVPLLRERERALGRSAARARARSDAPSGTPAPTAR